MREHVAPAVARVDVIMHEVLLAHARLHPAETARPLVHGEALRAEQRQAVAARFAPLLPTARGE